MSRFSKLIDQLEDLDQQDLKNTAKVFSITAHLYERLQTIVDAQSTSKEALAPAIIIDKKLLLERYGSYDNAYQAYQKVHGIKCKRSWNNLLPLVKDLPIPQTTEERIEKLEQTVQLLSEILLKVTSSQL